MDDLQTLMRRDVRDLSRIDGVTGLFHRLAGRSGDLPNARCPVRDAELVNVSTATWTCRRGS